ncbi:MAG: hypothetical protein M3464_11440 [Chloroflexota bacterium]|nr:hypothetical protein [Chloroflexota bacterium]
MASDYPATIVSEPPRTLAVTEGATTIERSVPAPWRLSVARGIWALAAVGLVAFIAFARVPIAAGWRQGRSLRVTDIWSFFIREVTVVAGPFVTAALVTALVIIILAGCLIGLWLAMSVTTDSSRDQSD